ncbi:Proliferation-associated protein 2G4 [Platysternon megacephalum]|uniref:Proliferation-associated protein 2G4 n=1 Tax=Platysternon megacephalum TaxID=55544 RepID=A0A4D9E7G3_9SAUR|nr:Proliferation-associated protein 2G4 [Platysternon megacephalum]
MLVEREKHFREVNETLAFYERQLSFFITKPFGPAQFITNPGLQGSIAFFHL